MCYDFYDHTEGYKDGYTPNLDVMTSCPYTEKSSIIMYAMGFSEGRKQWYKDHPTPSTPKWILDEDPTEG